MAHHSSLLVLLLPLLISVVASSSVSYSPSQALTELYLSFAAYCPQVNITSWNCYFCKDVSNFHVVATFDNSATNIFGYVGYSGSVGQVVFRGTQSDSIEDWIDDLDFFDTSVYSLVSGGEVHSGFYNSWNSVKTQVEAAVKTLSEVQGISQIYYTGHSLGAAITLFAALEVGTAYPIPFKVYNFGEPRVGNQIFANYVNREIGDIVRVTHHEDIVPHLPPEDFGFYHVATEVYYTSDTHYTVCDNSGEDSECSDGNWFDTSVSDHLDYLGITLSSGGC